MKVFLSWSGELSRLVAEELRDWLPRVIQSVEPFFTPSDIEKGAIWHEHISRELETCGFGLICLTSENLERPWIHFEAGALSKGLSSKRVCPLLVDVDNSALPGPLQHFQATRYSEDEMEKILKAINANQSSGQLDPARLHDAFLIWWPRLNERVQKHLMHQRVPVAKKTRKSDRQLLEELHALVRLSDSAAVASKRIDEWALDASAVSHTLKCLVGLCEQVSALEKFGELKLALHEIYSPLKFLFDRGDFPEHHRHDCELAIAILDTKFSTAST